MNKSYNIAKAVRLANEAELNKIRDEEIVDIPYNERMCGYIGYNKSKTLLEGRIKEIIRMDFGGNKSNN